MPEKKETAILVRPRIYIGDNATIGPGKIELLKALQTESSITAAAKSLNIPYKKRALLQYIDLIYQFFYLSRFPVY